ncbi:hypothetical protein QNI22_04600 [Cytophagaceae bacterium BD1B2-1]|uniref:Uncharacterized protein n=1 Tax=Xanthocytophaga agilis TaxID=3048010 RepID=A0AAE3UEU1_9BACT|nr:hypothetical protein [Xanthocytophaga agilis]
MKKDDIYLKFLVNGNSFRGKDKFFPILEILSINNLPNPKKYNIPIPL